MTNTTAKNTTDLTGLEKKEPMFTPMTARDISMMSLAGISARKNSPELMLAKADAPLISIDGVNGKQ